MCHVHRIVEILFSHARLGTEFLIKAPKLVAISQVVREELHIVVGEPIERLPFVACGFRSFAMLTRSIKFRQAMALALEQCASRLKELLIMKARDILDSREHIPEVRRPEYRVEHRFVTLEQLKYPGARMFRLDASTTVFHLKVDFTFRWVKIQIDSIGTNIIRMAHQKIECVRKRVGKYQIIIRAKGTIGRLDE